MSGKPSPRFQTSETRKPGRPHPTQPRPGGPPGPLSPLAAAPAAALRAGREEGPGRGTGLARSSSESVSEPTEGLATAQARVSAAETSRSPPKESQLLCRQYTSRRRRSVSEEGRQGAGLLPGRALVGPVPRQRLWRPRGTWGRGLLDDGAQSKMDTHEPVLIYILLTEING